MLFADAVNYQQATEGSAALRAALPGRCPTSAPVPTVAVVKNTWGDGI